MAISSLNPLQDPRWPKCLQRHPAASVFHTPGWLEALHRTYGYQPIVFTTAEPGRELNNGIVFCRVKDWLRGCRMVSVPFSDHCQPLVDSEENLELLLASMKHNQEQKKWKYIELRPLVLGQTGAEIASSFARGEEFLFHVLDLQPSLDTIFHNFHKSCLQRKIRRAEREKLDYEAGRSESLLAKFYHLLLITRRRHQLPPQPMAWFRNLSDCMGDSLTIRLVSKDGQPIASLLTLSFKNSLVYKYGCSDAKYHNCGGMPLLFWKTIQEAKELGVQELDLGRSEVGNEGLIEFKGHLGATGSRLAYLRIERQLSRPVLKDWKVRFLRKAVTHIPDPFLKLAGNLFYRYIG
ncbi:MAG TPA: GNAT family N-acetyltransferase [Candidatus Sulfotelmatobacter sp.]|nr:GNAT family N-acetyltransferase [Candidatus Sulfotelmatobacter sp.]